MTREIAEKQLNKLGFKKRITNSMNSNYISYVCICLVLKRRNRSLSEVKKLAKVNDELIIIMKDNSKINTHYFMNKQER